MKSGFAHTFSRKKFILQDKIFSYLQNRYHRSAVGEEREHYLHSKTHY